MKKSPVNADQAGMISLFTNNKTLSRGILKWMSVNTIVMFTTNSLFTLLTIDENENRFATGNNK